MKIKKAILLRSEEKQLKSQHSVRACDVLGITDRARVYLHDFTPPVAMEPHFADSMKCRLLVYWDIFCRNGPFAVANNDTRKAELVRAKEVVAISSPLRR